MPEVCHPVKGDAVGIVIIVRCVNSRSAYHDQIIAVNLNVLGSAIMEADGIVCICFDVVPHMYFSFMAPSPHFGEGEDPGACSSAHANVFRTIIAQKPHQSK